MNGATMARLTARGLVVVFDPRLVNAYKSQHGRWLLAQEAYDKKPSKRRYTRLERRYAAMRRAAMASSVSASVIVTDRVAEVPEWSATVYDEWGDIRGNTGRWP